MTYSPVMKSSEFYLVLKGVVIGNVQLQICRIQERYWLHCGFSKCRGYTLEINIVIDVLSWLAELLIYVQVIRAKQSLNALTVNVESDFGFVVCQQIKVLVDNIGFYGASLVYRIQGVGLNTVGEFSFHQERAASWKVILVTLVAIGAISCYVA